MKKLRGWACLALILVMAFAASCHSQAASASEKKVFTYLTDEMGLSPAAACGIMGNIQAESRFLPTAGSMRGAYGLCQWTGVRISRLVSHCNANGLSYSSIEGQLSYMNSELHSLFPGVLSHLKSVSNSSSGAYSAGYHWCYNFERPANAASASAYRGSIAQQYWSSMGSSVLYVTGKAATKYMKLQWTEKSKGGYMVMRSLKPDKGYVKIADLKASAKSYVDKTVSVNKIYYYKVWKKDADGNKLSDSNRVTYDVQRSLTDSAVKVKLAKTSYVYNGKARKPAVKVTYNGKTLKKGRDYSLTYKNNKDAGKASVIIKGLGAYTGKRTVKFTINKAKQKLKVASTIVFKTSMNQVTPRTTSQGKIRFISADSSIVSVKGKVLYAKGQGKTKVTVKAAATKNYLAAQKVITVRVKGDRAAQAEEN